ncbi:MAG: hypothetical protein BIFFINMI_03562 [Phycisphaerae bacterium]|nr:hypothetical protein [Phycisphaerae bacterium]
MPRRPNLKKMDLTALQTMLATTRSQVVAIEDELRSRLDALRAQLDGSPAPATKTKTNKASAKKTKTRRTNRSRQQLEAAAKRIADLITKAGADGVSGADIKAKVNDFPNIRGALEKYCPDFKFGTKGQKTKMVYIAK